MAEKRKPEPTYGSCESPAGHRDHMCHLMEKGQTAEIQRRSGQPAFSCVNCGARADAKEDLCNPERLKSS